MRSAIAFCFFLLIAGAWTESEDSVIEEIVEEEELDSVVLSVVSRIDSSLTRLENGIEGFKTLTWTTIDVFKSQADKTVDTVREFVAYSADKLEFELSRLLNHEVSELTCDLVGRFREQATLVFNNARRCIEGPIDNIIERARRISETGTDIRFALQTYRKEVLNCKLRSRSFSEGLQCVTRVSQNVNQLALQIPTFFLSMVDLGLELSSYPSNLQFCIAQTPLNVIREHYLGVLVRFPECLSNKLAVTAANVLERLSSAYVTIKEKFTRSPFSGGNDMTNQILFSLEEINPPNATFVSEFLKTQQYPNLEVSY